MTPDVKASQTSKMSEIVSAQGSTIPEKRQIETEDEGLASKSHKAGDITELLPELPVAVAEVTAENNKTYPIDENTVNAHIMDLQISCSELRESNGILTARISVYLSSETSLQAKTEDLQSQVSTLQAANIDLLSKVLELQEQQKLSDAKLVQTEADMKSKYMLLVKGAIAKTREDQEKAAEILKTSEVGLSVLNCLEESML